MLVVGLTGGIASGKSVVAQMLKERGAQIIDADLISREIMTPRSECWGSVVRQFGKGILDPDLTINRKKLAVEIFADEQKRFLLSSIVHPFIRSRIDEILSQLRTSHPRALVIVDAALLVETGQYRDYDTLVVVAVREEIQLDRLMARDGLTREEALSRVRAQLPVAEKEKVADYVINNEGSLKETGEQTERICKRLLARAAAIPDGRG